MEKLVCKACQAVVDSQLEFCSSCGEWLGLRLGEVSGSKASQEQPKEKRTRIPQLKCSNCKALNPPSVKYCNDCGQLLIKPLSSYGATSLPTRKEVPGIRAVFFLAVVIPLIAAASYYYNQNIAEEVIEEVQIVQQSTTSSTSTTVKSNLQIQFPFSCSSSSTYGEGWTCESLYDREPTSWQDKGLECQDATLEFLFAKEIYIEFLTFENLDDTKSFTRNFKARDILITSDESEFSVEKELENQNSSTQWIDLNTTTTKISIQILSAYPGEELNGAPAFTECAIQEITFYGRG